MRTPRFYDFRKRGNWYRLVPSTSIVLFFLTMAMMLWTLDTREGEQLRTSLARDALWAEQTLQLRMEDNLNQVTELARGAGRGDLDESGFQIQSSQFLANTPELIGIVRADTGMILRWIAPYEAGFLTPGSGLSGESASAFVEARIRERPIYSAPYQGPAGDWRFELQVPIFRDGQFVGSMVAIFSAGSLIRRLPPAWFAEKYQLELVDKSGRELARNAQNRLRNELYETLALPGTGLSIVARPVKSAVTQSHLLQTGLIGGLTLLTLLSLVSLNRHIHRRQDAERERDRVYRLSQELLGVVRRDTTILQVNPAFGQALGYPGETLVGTSFLNYLYPDARETAREIFERLFEVDGADRFEETRVVTRGGEVRWIVWALSPLRDSGVVYLAGRDITAEKQAEEALKREFAFRQAMEDSLVVGIRAIDLTGRITYVNPAFCTITGFSAAELIGILPPYPYWRDGEGQAENRRNMELALSGAAPREGFETVLCRKNGTEFHAHLLVSPLIDPEGQHAGWMTALTDITDRQEARRRLEASHERFVTVIEGLDAAVAVVDPSSHELLFCNQRYRHWFALRDDPGGSGYCDLALLPLLERGRDDDEIDVELEQAETGRWLSIRRRPVRWVDGRQVSMVLLTDITEAHENAARYEAQLEKLQATSRLVTMGEMASTLAHELNQPLSAIANYQAGCIERLRQGRATPESLLPVMEKITAQAERAGKIVRRVREFVKQSEPNRQPCRVPDIVEATLAIAEIEARRLGTQVEVMLAPGLNPVLADPILIEQVLINLMKNGLEAMQDVPLGERYLTVRALQTSARRIEISIADRGPGVPDALKLRLFDAFFTTKPEGMGMGLNICRTIIEFHQGQLWVEDGPDGGSIFRFTLPVYEA